MANAKTRGEIQKCNVCGNIIEVMHVGGGPLVCCGQPMEILAEKGAESEGKEKHVPVVEKTMEGIHPVKSPLERGAPGEQFNWVKVKIGSIPHPMEEKHHIEWIEIWPEGAEKSCRKYLEPRDVPEAEFKIQAEKIIARAYCNIHGLWKAEAEV